MKKIITGTTIKFIDLSDHNKQWVMDNIMSDDELMELFGIKENIVNEIEPDDKLIFFEKDGSLTMMPK